VVGVEESNEGVVSMEELEKIKMDSPL